MDDLRKEIKFFLMDDLRRCMSTFIMLVLRDQQFSKYWAFIKKKKKEKSFLIKPLLQETLLRTGKGKTFQRLLAALEADHELELGRQDPQSRHLQGQSPLAAEAGACAQWVGWGELLPSVWAPCSGTCGHSPWDLCCRSIMAHVQGCPESTAGLLLVMWSAGWCVCVFA